MSRAIDFVTGSTAVSDNDNRYSFDLCYAYPNVDVPVDTDSTITTDHVNPRLLYANDTYSEDGLYTESRNILTKIVVKPCQINHSDVNKIKQTKCNRLLDILIYDVKIHPFASSSTVSESSVKINSVAILYKKKAICKTTNLSKKQLYKLLLRDSGSDSSNLFIEVQLKDGNSSILPLPLPKYSVTNSRVDVDFSVSTSSGVVRSGTVICIISLVNQGTEPAATNSYHFFTPNNDPNDPRNAITRRSIRRDSSKSKDPKYFLLEEPALRFDGEVPFLPGRSVVKKSTPREVEDVVVEPTSFDRGDMLLKNWFQPRRPLRPSSGRQSRGKCHGGRKEVLVVTALRGVEVPVREESTLVQPLLEIEWGDSVYATSAADGPAPIWHETFSFEETRTLEHDEERSVKLRLYDQHPVWGLQWLGEARIPVETHRNYQELERWVGLSPPLSPTMSLGYLQASPGQSYTRIYILMKMDRPSSRRTDDYGSIDTLSRTIQRCTNVPYKLTGIETSSDASKLAMLLPSLPLSYGPLTPKQALSLNKVDHFGRAALLASLLRGLGVWSAVLLGSSQTRKLTAYVLTINESADATIWDPEIGERYSPGDTQCSLTKISRLISRENIWVNVQKNESLVRLSFDTKSPKDWKPLNRSNDATEAREPQTLELKNVLVDESEEDLARSVEEYLKEKLNEWRAAESLTTIWNRHGATVLRGFLLKLQNTTNGNPDKKELKQLCRAYHTHGFALNLRRSSLTELGEQLLSTKIHKTAGPVEFALACKVHRYIGNAHSLSLAVVVLRSRE